LSNQQIEAMEIFREASGPGIGKIQFQTEPWKLNGVPRRTPEPYVETVI